MPHNGNTARDETSSTERYIMVSMPHFIASGTMSSPFCPPVSGFVCWMSSSWHTELQYLDEKSNKIVLWKWQDLIQGTLA